MKIMTRGAAALVALVVLAGCTGGEPDAAPSPGPTDTTAPSATPEPPPPAPETGACYRLELQDATAPTSDAASVPCRRRHTARTIHVGKVSNLGDGGGPVEVDSARVQQQLARTCRARFATYVGGTLEARRLSRLQVVWFSPTLEEHDAGADWFRCDVLGFGRGDELLPLPRRPLQDVLDRPAGLTTYGLCGTARPGSRGFTRVACGLDHSWVAVRTLPIRGGERYPGVRRVRAAGDEACADLVRERAGFPLEFSYGWEWPTRRQWAAGQRYGFCWAPA